MPTIKLFVEIFCFRSSSLLIDFLSAVGWRLLVHPQSFHHATGCTQMSRTSYVLHWRSACSDHDVPAIWNLTHDSCTIKPWDCATYPRWTFGFGTRDVGSERFCRKARDMPHGRHCERRYDVSVPRSGHLRTVLIFWSLPQQPWVYRTALDLVMKSVAIIQGWILLPRRSPKIGVDTSILTSPGVTCPRLHPRR